MYNLKGSNTRALTLKTQSCAQAQTTQQASQTTAKTMNVPRPIPPSLGIRTENACKMNPDKKSSTSPNFLPPHPLQRPNKLLVHLAMLLPSCRILPHAHRRDNSEPDGLETVFLLAVAEVGGDADFFDEAEIFFVAGRGVSI